MRVLVLVLVAANLLFFAWTRGWLDPRSGRPESAGHEPQRLAAQEHPERIQPLSASAVSALGQRVCLELGPFEDDTSLGAAQTALRGAGLAVDWVTRSSEIPGQFAIATIKLDNADFRARKEATYKQMKISTEPLTGLPSEQPALVLSRHGSQADARTALAAYEKRGLKGLRIVTLVAPKARHLLVVPQADGLSASKLKALKDAALGSGFRSCSPAATAQATASAAS